MESSVSLQEPFSYALWPVIVAGIAIATAVVFWLVIYIRRKKEDASARPIIVKAAPKDIVGIKKKYIGELDKIGADFENGRLDIRHAYQKMSVCIRKFVHEMTGIKVQNFTLQDIGILNIPALYSLVAEYYAPEFARKSEGDVKSSIARTRSMIERWT